MSSLNKVQLIGNLAADPEIRSTQQGSRIANLRVATSERWKTKEGEQREKAEFHRVVVFAENLTGVCEKYLAKGSKVYIEGQLETRKWQDQSGQDRYSTEIVMRPYRSNLIMLDDKGGGNQQRGSYQEDPAPYDDGSVPF